MSGLKHKAKKSLGQNFLKSEPALKKIVEVGEVTSEDVVLEIGPGKGALTSKLLERAGQVIAVEKDGELFTHLQEKFSQEIESGKLFLIQDDVLDLSTSTIQQVSSGPRFSSALLRPDHDETSKSFRYKIIANIPYNITGAILKKFLTDSAQPERMVLMVQKEVAQRIVASDGKESILSISVKAYGTPKMVMKVPARYFSPAPKVDSAVILITNISRKVFGGNSTNETDFWEIVKKGFAHKRKKLSGNLKSVQKINKTVLETIKDKRSEELTLNDWVNLANL